MSTPWLLPSKEPTSYPVVIPAATSHRCAACHQDLPVECFPEGIGRKSFICQQCHQEAKIVRRAESKREAARDIIQRLGLVAAKERAIVPTMTEVAAKILASFNGIDEFVKSWKAEVDKLAVTRPGSKLLMDQYGTVYRMVKAASEERLEEDKITISSDEALDRAMEALLAERMSIESVEQVNVPNIEMDWEDPVGS